MVNHQAFIQTIQNLTGEATIKELVKFSRHWLNEIGDRLSAGEAERILNALDHSSNQTPLTLGVLCVLIAKLANKMRSGNEADLLECLTELQAILSTFDAQQLQWAPDIYERYFENIGQCLLKKNVPIWGIALLEKAILTYTGGSPSHLTNIHSTLLCLCLKARHFDRALPFLQVDATELFKKSSVAIGPGQGSQEGGEKTNGVSSSESSSSQQPSGSITSTAVSFLKNAVSSIGSFGVKSDEPNRPTQPLFKRRSVLLYFYYGAMVYGALEQWEEAALFLEHAICLPCKKSSHIVLEALKKYFIVSLIIGRKKPLESLPTYRTPIIQRNLLNLAAPYAKLPSLLQKAVDNKNDVVAVLTVYLEEKRSVFARDQNIGLMKVLINVCRENSVKRLGNIFVSLQLSDVARMAHLPLAHNDPQEENSVEQIILHLRQQGQLVAHVDGRTQTVIFEEKPGPNGQHSSREPSKAEIDLEMAQVIQLAHTIRAFDDAIRLNPQFIERNQQKGKERQMPGGNGGGGHSSVFPEDEGFLMTGSP